MTGMPFYIEKGPQFSVIESYVLDDPKRGIALLNDLRANGTAAQAALSIIASGIGLNSSKLDAGPQNAAERVKHLNEHWFEQTQAAGGKWQKDTQPEEPARDASGAFTWWQAYAGDVYEIMRVTMITAAEVSLGLAPDAAPSTGVRTKPWPIEIFWHCGQNWFEGWVTWRAHGAPADLDPLKPDQPGQVTVLLCTPTAGTPVRPSPLAPAMPKDPKKDEQGAKEAQRATAQPYAVDPATNGRARGMTVTTHQRHELIDPPTGHPLLDALGLGFLVTPDASYWRGTGKVVTVMPSEPDGGVLPNGRPYQP